jgi:hypothetical protein
MLQRPIIESTGWLGCVPTLPEHPRLVRPKQTKSVRLD